MKIITSLLSTIIAFGALSACSPKKTETSPAKEAVKTTPSSDAMPEGGRLAELSFDSIDTEGRGYWDLEQTKDYAELIHISMDGDEDGNVTKQEFLSWGFGLQNVAIDKNRVTEYENSLLAVYDSWDANGDGQLTMEEHISGIQKDFASADTDHNGQMSKAEYFTGFPILVASKKVLKPE